MQFSDTHRQVNADLDAIFSRGADAIGFTEVDPGNLRPVLHAAAKDHGYVVPVHRTSEAVAVRRETLLDHGVIPVHAGRLGLHGPRHIDWVEFKFGPNSVFFHEAHWVTGHGRDASRKRDHIKMTKAMIEATSRHGGGRHLSFFAGDINIDERFDKGQDHSKPDYLFNQAGLTTIWDELHRTIGTHGRRTIDILGSYDRDGRVSAQKVKVWEQLNADHRQVSAWYRIKP